MHWDGDERIFLDWIFGCWNSYANSLKRECRLWCSFSCSIRQQTFSGKVLPSWFFYQRNPSGIDGDQEHSLAQVVDALSLSKATMAKVHQNLAWAVAYNIVAIPIAAGVLLPQFDFAMTPSLSGKCWSRTAVLFLNPNISSLSFVNDTWFLGGVWCRGVDGPELHLCRQQFFASAAAWVVSEHRETTGWFELKIKLNRSVQPSQPYDSASHGTGWYRGCWYQFSSSSSRHTGRN